MTSDPQTPGSPRPAAMESASTPVIVTGLYLHYFGSILNAVFGRREEHSAGKQ